MKKSWLVFVLFLFVGVFFASFGSSEYSSDLGSCVRAQPEYLKSKWGLMENDKRLTTEEVLSLVRNYNLGVYYFQDRESLDLKKLKESGLILVAMSYGGLHGTWAERMAKSPYVDGLGYDLEAPNGVPNPSEANWLSDVQIFSQKAKNYGKFFIITSGLDRDYENSQIRSAVSQYADVVLPFYYGRDVAGFLQINNKRSYFPNKPIYPVGSYGYTEGGENRFAGMSPSQAAQVPGTMRSGNYASFGKHYVIFGGADFLYCAGLFGRSCSPGSAWSKYSSEYKNLLNNLKNNYQATVSNCKISSTQVETESSSDTFSSSETLSPIQNYPLSLLDSVGNNLEEYLLVDLVTGNLTYLDQKPENLLVDNKYKTNVLVLKRVSKGSFEMGSSYARGNGPRQSNDYGESSHGVTISYDYYISIFKITQKQYELIMGQNPTKSFYIGLTKPVLDVSWNKARGGNWPENSWPGNPSQTSFVGRLSSKTGLKFDLPTEAMWEYSCKAGTTTDFSSGVQYAGDPSEGSSVPSDIQDICVGGFYTITDVGTKNPNPWGLYDFHCNGREWVLDYATSSGYLPEITSSLVDPFGMTYSLSLSYVSGGWITRMTKNDQTTGVAGARCADKDFDYWGSSNLDLNYWSDQIYGPGFRVAMKYIPPACAESNWNYSVSPAECPASGIQQRIWSKMGICEGGVTKPNFENVPCQYISDFSYLTDSDNDGVLSDVDLCPNSRTANVNIKGCEYPRVLRFVLEKDLSNEDLRNVQGFSLRNERGSINFKESVSLVSEGSEVDLDSAVLIENNKVSIDTSVLNGLNKPASITLNNLNFSNPKILYNGQECFTCVIESYVNGTLTFSVPGFSVYEVVEGNHEQVLPQNVNECEFNITETCYDGSVIVIKECVGSPKKFNNTGRVCPIKNETICYARMFRCSDGSQIVSEKCVNGTLVQTQEVCPREEIEKQENNFFWVWVIVGLVVILLIYYLVVGKYSSQKSNQEIASQNQVSNNFSRYSLRR